MENPRTSSGKTQYYLLRLREDWRTCRTACRPVALRLALFFFKKVLSLCPYHWLLETLAFRPSVNSLSWCIPLYLITLCTVFLNLMKVLHIWLYDVILRFVVTFSHLTLSDYSSFNQQMHFSVSWCPVVCFSNPFTLVTLCFLLLSL